MITDEALLIKAKKLAEEQLGWGPYSGWVNGDFIALSKEIGDKTGGSLSPITLKRLWGKVKYEGMPQLYTLNTLAQFVGYDSWRDFKIKQADDAPPIESPSVGKVKKKRFFSFKIGAALAVLAAGIFIFIAATKKRIDPRQYSFSSRKVLDSGIPNSVVFSYDASQAPTDSVIIQQSWDTSRRTTVSKKDKQRSLIYYFPGSFKAKLIVDGEIVKEQDILITSKGWLTVLDTKPVPLYFKKEEAIGGGQMSLPLAAIKSRYPFPTAEPLQLSYCNVQDFGEIYSDDFVFETAVKNTDANGMGACQLSNIYLLCEGTAFGIPLCARGCQSAANLLFPGIMVSGKEADLSPFGVNFDRFIKVRVESKNGKAKVFLNDQLAYAIEHGIARSRIIGIDYVFQGAGAVDYVTLANRQVSFKDDFTVVH